MPATALISGVNYSGVNISVVLFGTPIIGITSIKYNRKQKKENNYGFGAEPVSRGYGQREYEGSIDLYLDTWKSIIDASPGRDALAIGPFDIQVLFGGQGVLTTKDVLKACEFLEDPFDGKSGDTKLMVTVPIIIGRIER